MVSTSLANVRGPLPAFGRLLRDLRVAADLTQEELAERAGVSARLVSDLERGIVHRPRRDTVRMLADALGLSGPERDSFSFLARGKTLSQNDAKPVELRVVHEALPSPASSFVGRSAEINAVTSLLVSPGEQLITLTGPGGVGKTRLALELANQTSEAFPGGIYLVDLAPLQDAQFLVDAIARSLGVRPRDDESVLDAVTSFLESRRALLFLDNFEHLVEAAAAISEIVDRCAELKVLTTSRKPLRLQVEYEYPVAPLELPTMGTVHSADVLGSIPSVELFVHRAIASNNRFHLTDDNAASVAEVTVRLDGLPLAIELAAARMRIMSPAELLNRLQSRLPLLTGGAQDLPTRLRTVRATIDWSHDLLSSEEQALFRRLAAFTGGCTLNAVEVVASSNGEPEPELLDALTGLVEHSLIRVTSDGPDDHRFSMLETIREYASDRLRESGEEASVRRRHAAWCLDLAESAEFELLGPDRQAWYDRLDREHANTRSAIAWLIAQRDVETAMRIAGALFRFWANSGRIEESRVLLDDILGAGVDVDPVVEAKVLQGRGVIAHFQGLYADATRFWERALELNRAGGNKLGIGSSYGNLGLAADDQGDYDKAAKLYGSALDIFIEIDDKTHINFMLNNLGVIAYMQGNFENAQSYAERSLKLSEELGDPDAIAYALGNLGQAFFGKGDYERATSLQRDALNRRMALTNQPPMMRNITNFAHLAAMTGRPIRAARLYGAAAAVRREVGIPLPPGDKALDDRYVAHARSQTSVEDFENAWREGEAMSLDQAIAIALDDSLD